MKFLITLTILLISFYFTYSQQKLSLKLSTGYGIGIPSESLGINDKQVYRKETSPDGSFIPTVRREIDVVQGSYSNGINISLSAGYHITENFLVELAATWNRGREWKTSERNEDQIDERVIYWSDRKTFSSSSLLSISPTTIVTIRDGKVSPYVLTGISFNFPYLVLEKEFYSTYPDESKYDYREDTYYRHLEIGFRTGLGIKVEMNERTSFIMEINHHSVTFKPTHKEITGFIIDNDDQLDSLTIRERETRYMKSIITTSGNGTTNSDSQPSQSLPVSFSFTNLSAQVGFQFML